MSLATDFSHKCVAADHRGIMLNFHSIKKLSDLIMAQELISLESIELILSDSSE